MEYDKIKQLMDDMDKSKLSELDIEFSEGFKIRMKKADNQTIAYKCIEKEDVVNVPVKQEKAEETKEVETGKIVKSPMVGTFYLKPSPDANPYVEIGQDVKQGQTLCIIEAMKLMNEIESEYTGKVKKVLINDGDPVEYGTELFVIE